MTNTEIIYTFLKSNYQQYCDDCLSEILNITPRQQVNQICNNSENGISSDENGKCYKCKKIKKIRYIDINNLPAGLLATMNRAIAYDNTRLLHFKSMKETEANIKKELDSDFETNLFLKLKEFCAYVSAKSQIKVFDSFVVNKFINSKYGENYKKEIWDKANSQLQKIKSMDDFGSGQILNAIIGCIEIKGNNLLEWQSKKRGPEGRVHAKLYEILKTKQSLAELEETIWKFYFTDEQPEFYFFDVFTKIVNKKYSLISYLYFIKDKSKYLPLATNTFDDFFKEIGINLVTKLNCSWENYYSYISIMEYIRTFLRDNLDPDTCLLDAHSFAWILERQYKFDLKNNEYIKPKDLEIKEKDREAVIKARVGQGLYRKRLLDKWNNKSSVSDYSNTTFMIASHIKPWKKCNNVECIDCDNGLLLTPNYDFLFDKGYITFNDDGFVIISKALSDDDLREFNVNKNLRIKEVSDRMKEYLAYHRAEIFKE